MPSFHDVRFPEQISYGSKGGPGFSTSVLTLASGFEKRNVNWSQLRAKYDVSHGIKTQEQMEELLNFFVARQGKAYSFRFKDFLDYQITDQTVGTGDGVKKAFQFYRTYSDGTYSYNRLITKPVEGSIVGITVNGVVAPEGPLASGWTMDYTTGVFTFTNPPANGADIRCVQAEFDVHVRFDTDDFDALHDSWRTLSWSSIPLVEIKEKWLA